MLLKLVDYYDAFRSIYRKAQKASDYETLKALDQVIDQLCAILDPWVLPEDNND